MSTQVKRSFPGLLQVPVISLGQPIFTAIGYFFGRVFGCWHLKMSRPKTRGRFRRRPVEIKRPVLYAAG
jgi:hypothetical protein